MSKKKKNSKPKDIQKETSSIIDANQEESDLNSKPNLSHLMDEARSSLFQFGQDMDFVDSSEELKKSEKTRNSKLESELPLDIQKQKEEMIESIKLAKSIIDSLQDDNDNYEAAEGDIDSEIKDEKLTAQVNDSDIATTSDLENISELDSFKTVATDSQEFLPDFNEDDLIPNQTIHQENLNLNLAETSNAFLKENESVESGELTADDTAEIEREFGIAEDNNSTHGESTFESINDSEMEAELNTELDTELDTFATEAAEPSVLLEGTELAQFDSAIIEDVEFIAEDQLQSVIESILFASDRPVSLATIKQVFLGTNVTNVRIKSALERLRSQYAAQTCGVSLEDVGSGFQLRTKLDNMEFLRRSLKAKPFKLSGPALEVLAIVAYKQPTVKSEIDQIRGVESGHLLRALMEKNLVIFAGKSDLPGKPMQYVTSRKFLEIFSLRNLRELPTLSQIDELLPEGIGEEEIQKPKLHDITDGLSQQAGMTYSEGEEELNKITDQLLNIQTSSDFFEQEKVRQRLQKDAERAQNIREALAVGEVVNNRDLNWLKRYEEKPVQDPSVEGVQLSESEPMQNDSQTELQSETFSESLSESATHFETEEVASWADPEIMEANDLADIDSDEDTEIFSDEALDVEDHNHGEGSINDPEILT